MDSHVALIANASAHIKGVVNLRGVIVPILDLRVRFGKRRPRYSDQTIVIVQNVLDRVIGVLVDAVSATDDETVPTKRSLTMTNTRRELRARFLTT